MLIGFIGVRVFVCVCTMCLKREIKVSGNTCQQLTAQPPGHGGAHRFHRGESVRVRFVAEHGNQMHIALCIR